MGFQLGTQGPREAARKIGTFEGKGPLAVQGSGSLGNGRSR